MKLFGFKKYDSSKTFLFRLQTANRSLIGQNWQQKRHFPIDNVSGVAFLNLLYLDWLAIALAKKLLKRTSCNSKIKQRTDLLLDSFSQLICNKFH